MKRVKHTHCHHHKKKHNKNFNEEIKESKIYDNFDNVEYANNYDRNKLTFRTMAATSFEFYHKEMLSQQKDLNDETVTSNCLNLNELKKSFFSYKNLIINI